MPESEKSEKNKACLIITPKAFQSIVKDGFLNDLVANMAQKHKHRICICDNGVLQIFNEPFDDKTIAVVDNYYDLHYYEANDWKQTIYDLTRQYPDNYLIVVNSLAEFDDLNHTYGNDELIPYIDNWLYTKSIYDILLEVNERYSRAN